LPSLVVLTAFFFSLNYFIGAGDTQPQEELIPTETASPQLDQLFNQAEGLLQVGRPALAAEIIDSIRTIDPDYPNLADLSARTQDLLEFEAQYQEGLALAAQGDRRQALDIFLAIQAARPNLWDVGQQITKLETELQIEAYFQEGEAAYQAENWAGVINAYEDAQQLGASLDDPQIMEQLLKAYLNQIIVMLEANDTPIENIELAESYYRKALAMIPQSRAFFMERINLQDVSANLLEVKFSQLARAILNDKNQTVGTVAQAVAYTRRAANLRPRNTTLQQDLRNAELYQVGLRNFINLNWMVVITNLEPVIESEPNYAGGNAAFLLFEAYYAVSKQYFNAGIYQDALNYLEKAEFLVWRNLDNRAKLLQNQVLFGDTLSRLEDFENAVSYYQYALNAIDAPTKLRNSTVLAQKLENADLEASNENYEAAASLYQEVLQEIDVVYSVQSVETSDGAILALFAHHNQSTLDLVLRANNLQRDMVIRFGRTLQVPVIE
jgi:tetratricopeptide (TPR) repeat protein